MKNLELTMVNAIKTYSTLTKEAPEAILKKMAQGNEVVIENVKMLMFSAL